jgi:hypothetical protein
MDKIPFKYIKYNIAILYTYMTKGKMLETIRACKEGIYIVENSFGPKNKITLNLWICLANYLYFVGIIDECL